MKPRRLFNPPNEIAGGELHVTADENESFQLFELRIFPPSHSGMLSNKVSPRYSWHNGQVPQRLVQVVRDICEQDRGVASECLSVRLRW